MKIYKYILTGLICFFIINACDEDSLEVVNPNQLSPETFYTTPAQIQAAVNAVYANLQTRGLYSRHMFFMMDNMSHENAGNPQLESDKLQYLEFTFDPSHGAIRAYWQSCYMGINKANFLIGNQDKMDEIASLTATDKAKFVGEAKFMRALYYFYLVTRFGDIPLITEILTTGDGTPKSPASDVYNQIATDLTDAVAGLPAHTDAGYQPGRASKGAAYALLGKTNLFRGDYAAAKTAFENIIGEYALEANYGDNFMEETEHNSESIFEVEYDESLGTSSQWNSDADGRGLNESTFRGQEYGWNDWFNVYPSDDLINEFEAGDPRYTASFYSNGDDFAGGTVALGLSRVAGWRKYQNYYKRVNENINSSINPRVIRYADVLLMMAEIENEIGTPVAAIGYLNEVRDRVSMPNYGSAEMNSAGYPVTNKQEIFAAIVHERKVELAGEQCRFPDLVRWGLADGFLSSFGYQSGKNELFPIPQQEIDSNNAMTNADQNDGY